MMVKLDLPQKCDVRGNLTFVQYPEIIPFRIEGLLWRKLSGKDFNSFVNNTFGQVVFIALSGSFTLNYNDCVGSYEILIGSPTQAVYLSNVCKVFINEASIDCAILCIFGAKCDYIAIEQDEE
jgi:hypothetical protein